MAMDISTVGAIITIGNITTITEFSDEGTPFEAPDVEVSENVKNLNGHMISSRKPAVYPLSVTVIPGSKNDKELSAFLAKCSLMPGANGASATAGVQGFLIESATVVIPDIDGGTTRTYRYGNGRIKSGPTGPSTSAEGRQAARTFTFEFESFTPPSLGKGK